MTFRRLLSRVARRLRKNANAVRGLNVSGFEDLRPIGNARGAMITNKAGRAVFSARYRGRQVKIYEAFGPTHARFIAAVSERLPDLFPEVLEARGGWIIAEWVEGQMADELDTADHSALLRRLHETPLQGMPSAGFCYWSDFIAPRFLRAATLLGWQEVGERLVEEVAAHAARTPLLLSHPDLSAANLVRQPGGGLKSIDNELLCQGWLPMLDLCNAMRPMPQEGRDAMARAWFASGSGNPQEVEVTARAWIAREVGAAFVGGRLDRCEVLLRMAERDLLAALPFSVDGSGSVWREAPRAL